MTDSFKTISEYLASLPIERSQALEIVRKEILKNLPNGFIETINWGVICYEVPLEIYPNTYNKQPLMLASLASRKNYMMVSLCGLYQNEALLQWFQTAYKETGKKLDMGKSCVRFKTIEHLPVPLIGEVIKKVSLQDFLRCYETSWGNRK